MKKITLTIIAAIGLVFTAQGQQSQDKFMPEIAMLGMFHFGETSDLAAIDMKDLHGERRQAEIKDLVRRLQAYAPTKVLVEYPMIKADTLQKRYKQFLAGQYQLGDSETYQVGFRLAKALGHDRIYAMDHKMDLPFDPIVEHLQQNGRMEELNQMMMGVKALMQAESNALEKLPLSEYLLRLNSDKFDALANSLYLKEILSMGSPDNEVGAAVSAVWYHRNMIMLHNIARHIQSPQERILVIVGSSHRAVIRDYIEDRVDLNFVEIADYLRD